MSAHRSWPHHGEDEIAAVTRVLRSGKTNYWTGTECRSFEQEFAEHFQMPFAISVANGTVALELALIAFNIGKGDEVIVPAASYIATAGCVIARGATPVFADVDEHTQNITANTIRPLINKRTRAVIVVHLNGIPCDLDPILALRGEHNLVVIEDCAQAHGATYHQQPVGSFGDASAFSFCQDKIISTGGEGGMLLCRQQSAWQRAWSYKDHGKSINVLKGQKTSGPGAHQQAGSNWRMTEMQAAIGRLQLRRLDGWVARRRGIASKWRDELQEITALQLPEWPADAQPAWYRFPLRLMFGSPISRSPLLKALADCGIACSAGICPELYREPAMARFAPPERLPVARLFAETAFDLSLHPELTDEAIAEVGLSLNRLLGSGSRRTAT